ncbi:MAG: HAMP domain-containing protein [Candidatus Desantisbacteria bacterium]
MMGITIKKKLALSFSILIGLIVIISLLALMKLNEISSASHLTIIRSLIANYTNQIEVAVLECRRAEKNFWIRKEERYIERLKKEVKSIRDYSSLIMAATNDKVLKQQLNTINMLVDEYYDAFMKSAALFKAEQQKNKMLTENNRFVMVARQLQDIVSLMAEESRRGMEKELKITQKTTANVMGLIVVEAIMAVISGLLIAFFISTSITRSINNLMQTISRIQDGDIRARVEIKSQDELGVLGDYLNKMLDKTEEAKKE